MTVFGQGQYPKIVKELQNKNINLSEICSPSALYDCLLKSKEREPIGLPVKKAKEALREYQKRGWLTVHNPNPPVIHRPLKPPKVRRPKKLSPKAFYESREWMKLRYEAIKLSNGQCQACGAHGKDVQIHVDHIKPRSKYPELELVLANLQTLCRPCNLGKSNLDETDWRPDEMKERFLNAIFEDV